MIDFENFLHRGHHQYLPNLSIDHVIIGYQDKKLQCLLLRFNQKWLLPGGFIARDESVEAASGRILKEQTNLSNPHRVFLATFGNEDRSFADHWKEIVDRLGFAWKDQYWINDRFVTLAYYSLIDREKADLSIGAWHDEIAWFDFKDLPPMWMDHREIALYARRQLKKDVQKMPVAYHLLPQEFTMPELLELHRTILEETIDRSRFQKKMIATGIFERLPEKPKDTPGRNPYLYRAKNL